MVEFNEPGWIVSTPVSTGGNGVRMEHRYSKPVFNVDFDLGNNERPTKTPPSPAQVSPTFKFTNADGISSVSPRTLQTHQPSPQLRMSRSVTNLRKKVRIMGTSFEPTEPLPPISKCEEDGDDKGFFKSLINRRKSSMGMNLKFRRGSEPTVKQQPQRQTFSAMPSPVTRPLLVKPKARPEIFARLRARSIGKKENKEGSVAASGSSDATESIMARLSISTTNEVIPEPIGAEWTSFMDCYAQGRYNLSLPPDPPSSKIPGGFFSAPLAADEAARLKAVIACSVPFTERAEEKCRYFVSRAQQSFKTKWTYISFIDDEYENFKLDIPFENVGPVKRNVSIGSHALLTINEPMVILDTLKDWRFAENPLVKENPKIRFYAGAPIVNNDGYVVGVFAIADTESRPTFASSERRRLMDFGRTTMMEIEIIISEMSSTASKRSIPSISLSKSGSTRKRSDTSDLTSSNESMLSNPESALYLSTVSTLVPNSPSIRKAASVGSLVSFVKEAPLASPAPRTSPRSPLAPPTQTFQKETSTKSLLRMNIPSPIMPNHRNPVSAPKSSPVQITNLVETTYALSVMAYSMEFDLVYLLRIRPKSPFLTEEMLHDTNLYLKILASFGMPDPQPSFDANMHLKALRSTEGLIYSNRNDPEDDKVGFQTGVMLPLVQDKDRKASACGPDGDSDWAGCRSGIVLGAFSFAPKEIDEEMLAKMKEFGTGMREVLLKVDGYLDGGMLG